MSPDINGSLAGGRDRKGSITSVSSPTAVVVATNLGPDGKPKKEEEEQENQVRVPFKKFEAWYLSYYIAEEEGADQEEEDKAKAAKKKALAMKANR